MKTNQHFRLDEIGYFIHFGAKIQIHDFPEFCALLRNQSWEFTLILQFWHENSNSWIFLKLVQKKYFWRENSNSI